MPLMSGGDAVVRSVLAHGISTIYALPGVQSDHLFNAMFDAGDALSVVHTRHEQGAAYMALGAALATGKPAAYSVVPGPGFLNSTAALATAYSTGARVLALIGQIPSRGIGKGHGLLHEIPDQIGILRRLTKWAERVNTPQHGPDIIARAFQSLRSGRPRPVGVELPPDMLAARAEVEMSPPLPLDSDPPLDQDAIEWLAAKGYDPAYGARPLKRVIQKELQDPLAERILLGDILDGSTVLVTAGSDRLNFRPRPAVVEAAA